MERWQMLAVVALAPAGLAAGRSGSGGDGDGDGGGGGGDAGSVDASNPLTDPEDGPPAGNPDGECAVPAEAGPEDTSSPDRVVGDGTPESCTGDAFIEAVAMGGVITFDCGPDPVTITVDRPAKIVNDTGPETSCHDDTPIDVTDSTIE